jgi:hypothetical protein
LTVLVYPSGTSTFRYNDDDNGRWTTFKSVLDGARLTLSADPMPRAPLLYRVGRMTTKPTSVAVNGSAVLINQTGALLELGTEGEVNLSQVSAWFYDEAAHRLIVKVIP